MIFFLIFFLKRHSLWPGLFAVSGISHGATKIHLDLAAPPRERSLFLFYTRASTDPQQWEFDRESQLTPIFILLGFLLYYSFTFNYNTNIFGTDQYGISRCTSPSSQFLNSVFISGLFSQLRQRFTVSPFSSAICTPSTTPIHFGSLHRDSESHCQASFLGLDLVNEPSLLSWLLKPHGYLCLVWPSSTLHACGILTSDVIQAVHA